MCTFKVKARPSRPSGKRTVSSFLSSLTTTLQMSAKYSKRSETVSYLSRSFFFEKKKVIYLEREVHKQQTTNIFSTLSMTTQDSKEYLSNRHIPPRIIKVNSPQCKVHFTASLR